MRKFEFFKGLDLVCVFDYVVDEYFIVFEA